MATTVRTARFILPFVAAGAALALTSCSTGSGDPSGPPVPPGWSTYTLACDPRVSFDLPPSLTVTRDSIGIDTCIGEYAGAGQELVSDVGGFVVPVDPFSDPPYLDVVTWSETVDGREARFITSRRDSPSLPLISAVTFRNVWPDAPYPMDMTFFGYAETESERQDGLTIYRSIDFED